MRVLAVDPGLTRCGVGVVDGVPGRRLTLVEVGVIRTPAGDPAPKRLVTVEDEMLAWFDRHRPEAVAIERVFADSNVSTVMGTAQVTGIVMIIAERRGLPVALHTPTEVKAAVSGNGRADKAQVTAMVTHLLGLAAPPKPADAADALALAICHIWRGGTQSRLAEAAAAHAAARPPATRRTGGRASAGTTAARAIRPPTAGATYR
ncbi:MAG: crossover junction endodeoxyribonuclease RuvC [Dermatophilaceae bacterium]